LKFRRSLEQHLGLTGAGALLVTVAVLGWFLARVLGGRAVFLLAYATLALVGLAWVLGRKRVDVAAARASLSPRFRAGEEVEVSLEMVAKRRLSNVILDEMLPAELGNPVRVPVTGLAPGQKVTHDYHFTARQRGVFDIGPLEMTQGDPFGLTRKRTPLTGTSQIIVHPVTEPVRDRVATRAWEDPPTRPPVSKPWPTGYDIYGMRDYAMGDDPRRIAWRATARSFDPNTGDARYMVRESEQGITDRVALIIDTDSRTHSPGTPSQTLEDAVRTVASLAVRHLRDGFAITVDTNSRRIVDAMRGEHHRIRLLDELARVQREPVGLAEAVTRLNTERRRTTLHNVLVTPHIDAEAAARLSLLRNRGLSVLIVMVLWPDSDPISRHRASALGCNVVEISPGMALEGAFRRVVGAGVRRER